MAIISIARECFSHGAEIARRVADTLGYACISREVLVEAACLFGIPEGKLLHSIHDAPSVLERITGGREKYLACIRAALLERIKDDNVVYHGYAGHLLIPEIKHVLKVRLFASESQRVALVRRQQGLSRQAALELLNREDRQRAAWTRYLYGRDVHDPALYDLIVNLTHLSIADAVDIICHAARRESFHAPADYRRQLRDRALSSHVQAALEGVCKAQVSANNGVVHVRVAAQKLRKTGFADVGVQQQVREKIQQDLSRQVTQVAKRIEGVKEVICIVEPPYYA